ncbi:MAG: transposase [Opitutaceae bacterium]|nr:transposase [Opitutaceae bacterium]
MRHPRIKISTAENEAAYHCISRTVNGEWLLDDAAKDILRRQLWQVADYCGVNLVTYTILSNHFHVLVHVPQREPVPDNELLRRYRVLYPSPTKYQMARLEVIQAELSTNGVHAAGWRNQQLMLMGDVSQFMKLVKQRFSIWFNKSHGRFGTLWAERFKSELVEPGEHVLQTIAAYIDLNCVRAGIVTDPKEYRFCGYAEAVAGSEAARAGIRRMLGGSGWNDAQAQYRQMLFGTGAGAYEGAASIPNAEFQRVLTEGGKLPLATILRCRIRYFSDGAVLGSNAYVQVQLAAYRQKTGNRKQTAPRPLPLWTDWGDLTTLRRLRTQAIG